MLTVQNLRVEYGARVLFSDLSFSVQPRERIAFAGHNGAGKSTLMKAIAGIVEVSGGKVVVPRNVRRADWPNQFELRRRRGNYAAKSSPRIRMPGRRPWSET